MLIVLLSPFIGAACAGLSFLLLRLFFWRDATSGNDFAGHLIYKIQQRAGSQIEQKLLDENGVLQKELKRFSEREETVQVLSPSVANEVEKFVDIKLEQRWPMISMFLNAEAKEKMKIGLTEELLKAIPGALKNMGNGLLRKLETEHFIQEKIAAISVSEAKMMVRPYVHRVFQRLFWIMVIIGGIVGGVTGGLVWFFC